jgi:hypothetical protein
MEDLVDILRLMCQWTRSWQFPAGLAALWIAGFVGILRALRRKEPGARWGLITLVFLALAIVGITIQNLNLHTNETLRILLSTSKPLLVFLSVYSSLRLIADRNEITPWLRIGIVSALLFSGLSFARIIFSLILADPRPISRLGIRLLEIGLAPIVGGLILHCFTLLRRKRNRKRQQSITE